MIISHKFRYLFIEIPQTGSTAIHNELCENYDGEPILRKHASYQDFLRIATEEEKEYFVFATIRNPMDIVVSKYCKAESDHGGRYSKSRSELNGVKQNRSARQRREYLFIAENDADFAAYFRKFYRIVYNSRISMLPGNVGYLIRFEQLNDDFRKVLRMLNIEPVRDLPHHNRTGAKKKHFSEYYTPEIQAHAVRIFGPYLSENGYTFPDSWEQTSASSLSRVSYKIDSVVRKFYFNKVHYQIRPYTQ